MTQQSVVIFVALAVAGCTQSFEFPEHRPQDYPPVETLVLEESFALAPGGSTAIDFQMPDSGDLFATVDWTHDSSQVVAAFSSQRCADVNLALAGGCKEYVFHTQPSLCPAKPRVVTANAMRGSPVRLYLANTGQLAESARVRLVLCRDAPDCAQGLACAQCGVRALNENSCR